ncbi:hypothetical protein PHMEG_00029710, partial [Phytophthora megakarya]
LEPRKVRDDVKHHCKSVCTGARKNDFMLFNIIKEKARDQHKYLQLVLEQKVKTASVRKPDSSTTKRKSARADIRASNPRVSSPESSIVQTPRKVAAPPKTGWYCQGQHWLREWPTEDDKARAVERMKELKEKRCLPKPTEAIVVGGSTATCVYTVTVDIVLWTGAGNVHLREVKWWIMEGSETDFLLGKDTLVSLGIDENE